MKKTIQIIFFIVISIFLYINFSFPLLITYPVEGAGQESYNPNTFWYPWGDHPHRGIDFFAEEGTPVIASCPGIVIGKNLFSKGGNSVSILSCDGRIHYYAHMKDNYTRIGQYVHTCEKIGTVGRTGNASRSGCPAHLHYSIVSLVPYAEGSKGIWYVNPAYELDMVNELHLFYDRH